MLSLKRSDDIHGQFVLYAKTSLEVRSWNFMDLGTTPSDVKSAPSRTVVIVHFLMHCM